MPDKQETKGYVIIRSRPVTIDAEELAEKHKQDLKALAEKYPSARLLTKNQDEIDKYQKEFASIDRKYYEKAAYLGFKTLKLSYEDTLENGTVGIRFEDGVLAIDDGKLVECLRQWCQEGKKEMFSATIKITPNPGAEINARC